MFPTPHRQRNLTSTPQQHPLPPTTIELSTREQWLASPGAAATSMNVTDSSSTPPQQQLHLPPPPSTYPPTPNSLFVRNPWQDRQRTLSQSNHPPPPPPPSPTPTFPSTSRIGLSQNIPGDEAGGVRSYSTLGLRRRVTVTPVRRPSSSTTTSPTPVSATETSNESFLTRRKEEKRIRNVQSSQRHRDKRKEIDKQKDARIEYLETRVRQLEMIVASGGVGDSGAQQALLERLRQENMELRDQLSGKWTAETSTSQLKIESSPSPTFTSPTSNSNNSSPTFTSSSSSNTYFGSPPSIASSSGNSFATLTSPTDIPPPLVPHYPHQYPQLQSQHSFIPPQYYNPPPYYPPPLPQPNPTPNPNAHFAFPSRSSSDPQQRPHGHGQELVLAQPRPRHSTSTSFLSTMFSQSDIGTASSSSAGAEVGHGDENEGGGSN